MNLPKFQEKVEELMANACAPDEDLIPVLILEKDDEAAIVGLMMMESNDTKEMCAFIMEHVVRITNPDCACFVSTAWMSRIRENSKDKYPNKESVYDAFDRGEIVAPSKDPNREEIVIVICIGIRGENDGEVMMFGEIVRSPSNPPHIKQWTVHESEMHVEGRFADALKKGFASVDISGDLSRLSKLKGSIDETRNNTQQE